MRGLSNIGEFPVIGPLIERMKRFATGSAEVSELRRLDDHQIDEIAHDLGLSRSELFKLCAHDRNANLLQKRLAEFEITEASLAKKHPDVLRDLQRVCGTCPETSRCASDFTRGKASRRDEYCPNTCTLQALGEQGLHGQPERPS